MRFWVISAAALCWASVAPGSGAENLESVRKAAQAYRWAGDMARAVPLYKKWASREPTLPVLEQSADVCAAAGDYDAARFYYKKAMREAVRQADAEAVRRFRRRLSALPADLGFIDRLIAAENYAGAFKHLKARLNLHPGDTGALSLMGAVYEGIGQNRQAERLYRRAAALAPENPGPHYYLGRFYLLKKKKFEEALRELKTFRSLIGAREKELVQATRWIASIEATTLGRPDEAFAELEALVRKGRADAETLYDYGILAMRLDRRRTAYETFQKVARMAPDTELARYAEEAIEAMRSLPPSARYSENTLK